MCVVTTRGVRGNSVSRTFDDAPPNQITSGRIPPHPNPLPRAKPRGRGSRKGVFRAKPRKRARNDDLSLFFCVNAEERRGDTASWQHSLPKRPSRIPPHPNPLPRAKPRGEGTGEASSVQKPRKRARNDDLSLFFIVFHRFFSQRCCRFFLSQVSGTSSGRKARGKAFAGCTVF